MVDDQQAFEDAVGDLVGLLTNTLEHGEEAADRANLKPSRIPPLNKNGKFAPEGTFER